MYPVISLNKSAFLEISEKIDRKILWSIDTSSFFILKRILCTSILDDDVRHRINNCIYYLAILFLITYFNIISIIISLFILNNIC